MNNYNDNIVYEIPGLFKVIRLVEFRKTPGVRFDILPRKVLPKIDAVDRVLHEVGAVSPGPVAGVKRPWYMHPYQDDNLMVLYGTRYVELYTKKHGRIEKFEVTANSVRQTGGPLIDFPSMLAWPRGVFHRIVSGETGSASVNFAVHYPGFDINTNFNIYKLDEETGEFKVIREGFRDQFKWEEEAK